MKRLMLGVVVGFVAGLLVSKLFERPPDAGATSAFAAPAESTSTMAMRQPARAAASSDNEAATVVPATSRPIARDAGNSSRTDDSRVAFDGPAADYASRAQTTAHPQTATVQTVAGRAATAMPITLEPPLKKMIDGDPASAKMHAEIESEEDDLGWAYYMEEQLRSYFTTQPAAAAWQVTGLDCRTNGCVVQAQSATADMGQATTLIQKMSQQPWWEFVNARTSSTNFDQGIALLIMMQKKKKKKP